MIGYEFECFSFLFILKLFTAGNVKKYVFTVFIVLISHHNRRIQELPVGWIWGSSVQLLSLVATLAIVQLRVNHWNRYFEFHHKWSEQVRESTKSHHWVSYLVLNERDFPKNQICISCWFVTVNSEGINKKLDLPVFH